jgi:signal peptidase I
LIDQQGAEIMHSLICLWKKYKGVVALLVLMSVLRSAIADWNVVPSASMLPTIRPGDIIFVDKMAYDLRVPFTHVSIADFSDPKRGDIVTIDSSAAHELLVKRVIGLPGDSVAMGDNVLYIDGARAHYQLLRANSLPEDAKSRGEYVSEQIDGASHAMRLSVDAPSPLSSFGPVAVPSGMYLMLGDNRDDSADSRYFGFFARDEIMGHVLRIAFSVDPSRLYRPRFDRFGSRPDSLSLKTTARFSTQHRAAA